MKAFVCEMCGSNNLIKQDGFFVCQSCGTKHTTSNSEGLDEYLRLSNLAKTAFSERDYTSAFHYSTDALGIQPKSPDMLALKGASMFGKEPASDALVRSFSGFLGRSLASLKSNVLPAKEQKSICKYITGCIRNIATVKISELNDQEKMLIRRKIPFDPNELERVQAEYNRTRWLSNDAARRSSLAQRLNTLKMQEERAKNINPGLQSQINEIRGIIKKTEDTKTTYTRLFNDYLVHLRGSEQSDNSARQPSSVYSVEEVSTLETQLGELQREMKPIRGQIVEKRKQIDFVKSSNQSSHMLSYTRKSEINKRIREIEQDNQTRRGVFGGKTRRSVDSELAQLKKQLKDDEEARAENRKNQDNYRSELSSLKNELSELLAQEQVIKTKMENIIEKLKRMK